ncbi:hypothetical protein EJB05_19509, partial [Eragrostis curvula]
GRRSSLLRGLLRSVATKLAGTPRAPHHRLPALGGEFPRCSSRPFSSGSNNKDLTHDKKVVSKLDMYSSLSKFEIYTGFQRWILPAIDRMNEAALTSEDEIIQVMTNEFQKMHDLLTEQRRKEGGGGRAV